jgi:C_GCAxxG_C_C family probable redox protein
MATGSEIKLDSRSLDVIRFEKKGYCCSQIMILMMPGNRGRNNPDLVRAMAGLCNGVGCSGEICGVLTGGTCLLSLCAAKGSDDEVPNEGLPLMLWELTDWFRKRTEGEYGGPKCDEILSKSPDKRACLSLIVETYEKVESLLESRGLLISGEKDG